MKKKTIRLPLVVFASFSLVGYSIGIALKQKGKVDS